MMIPILGRTARKPKISGAVAMKMIDMKFSGEIGMSKSIRATRTDMAIQSPRRTVSDTPPNTSPSTKPMGEADTRNKAKHWPSNTDMPATKTMMIDARRLWSSISKVS